MSVNRCWPSSPPDSIIRSPAPTMRSNMDWALLTLLTRSSGISMPDLAMIPVRKITRSLVTTKWVVAQRPYRNTSHTAVPTISTSVTTESHFCTSPSATTKTPARRAPATRPGRRQARRTTTSADADRRRRSRCRSASSSGMAWASRLLASAVGQLRLSARDGLYGQARCAVNVDSRGRLRRPAVALTTDRAMWDFAAISRLPASASVEAAVPCAAPRPARHRGLRAPDDGRPLVFYGHGIGHGMGMSQYGARGAALARLFEQRRSSPRTTRARIVATVNTTGRLDVCCSPTARGPRATVTVDADAVSGSPRSGGITAADSSPCNARARHGGSSASGPRTRLVDGAGRVRFNRSRQPASRSAAGTPAGSSPSARTGTAHCSLVRRLKYDAESVLRRRWPSRRPPELLHQQRRREHGQVPVRSRRGARLVAGAAQRAQAIAARTFAIRLARPLRPTPADQYYGGYDPARDSPRSPWRRAVDDDERHDHRRLKRPPDRSALLGVDGRVHRGSAGTSGASDAVPVPAAPSTTADGTRRRPIRTSGGSRRSATRRIADEFGFDRVTAMSVAGRGTTARHRGVRITGRIAGDTVTRYVTGWDVRQALGLPSPGFLIVTR